MKRECCNYCMWYGPVNRDGTMRKHKPRDSDIYGANKQNMNAPEPCRGSNLAPAEFGEKEPSKASEPSLEDYAEAARIVHRLMPGRRS